MVSAYSFLSGLGLCLWAISAGYDNPDLHLFGWLTLCWAYLMMVASMLMGRHVLHRQYRDRFDEVELSFKYDDTTISMSTSRGAESRVGWESIKKWVETPTTLVLLQDAFWFYVHPKRVFTGEALDSMRTVLQTKVRSG